MAILLSELQVATATTSERRRGHWIGVHSDLWRRIIGGNYSQVIREAESLGLVEVNSRYSVGRFCKSMRLAEHFRTPQTAQYRLRRRTKNHTAKVRIQADDVVGRNLAACFDAVTIPQNIKARGWDLYSVRAVADRSWYATRCPYRRFHSSFTRMSKRIRRSMRIDGKPVVEVDVANCQPFIIGILEALKRNQTNNQTQTNKHTNTICCTVGDQKRYMDLCANGELSDYLLECCGGLTLWDCIRPEKRRRYAVDRRLNRSDVKLQFIMMMFADNQTMKQMPLWEIVAREFPTIAAFVEESKRFEYQSLAWRCQRFESKLMIDGVAAELVRRWPLITVHDSVLAAEENADQVASAIRSKFAALGVGVTVKVSEANG